ncbi:DUF624 domain-containing protein [Microbacterium sp.]|uniref:YesL family protein n=1 Tax=Microbacterium sp. TaxID=51671 RepID=UPI00289EE2BD|nr:DUF624 domain-containing protein [Microbacterium sp.]
MSADAQMGLGWTGRVMQLLQGACTLVLVNLLFAVGVVVGLGIVGVMPASVAAATVLLPGKIGKSGESGEIGTARRFVRAYRESFVRANLTGIPFLIAGVLLAADAAVLPRLGGPVAAALTALTTVVGLVVLLMFIVCVTLLVRYRDTPVAVLRYALTLPLTAPLTGAGVLLVLIAFAVIASVVPVVVPLVGASLPLVLATRLIDRRLATIDARHPASAGVPH